MTASQIQGAFSSLFYDRNAIKTELEKQSVPSSQINKALAELDKGDVSPIRQYNLEGRVQTSSALPPPATGGVQLSSSVEKMNVFNFLEAMQVLHETTKQLRQFSREMRHAERDAAFTMNINAADKIRSAAITNLVFGCVSGAVSIGMGVFAAGCAAKQMTNMSSPSADMKNTKTDLAQATSGNNLAQAQVKLETAQANLAATDVKIQQLQADQPKLQVALQDSQAKVATLETQHQLAQQQGPNSQQALDAKASLETAQLELKANQEAFNQNKADLQQAQETRTVQAAQLESVKAEVAGAAAESQKTNDAQIKSLEKSLKSKEAKIESLKAKSQPLSPANEAKLQSLQNQVTADTAKLSACQDHAQMLKNPTSPEALASAQQRLEATSLQVNPTVPGSAAARDAAAQAQFNHVVAKSQGTVAQVQALNQVAAGANQGIQGVGQMVSEGERAKGAEETAKAQVASSMESEDADYQKGFNDALQSLQDVIKQYLQSQNQTNRSIYQNM